MRRTRRILPRVVRFIVTFLLVTFAATMVLSLTPGDPAHYMAGETATPEVIEAINAEYRFDDPAPQRWSSWLGDLLQGSLGSSYSTKQPVWDAITERLPVTFELAVLAMLVALVIAVPLAVVTAARSDSRLDRGIGAVTSGLISMPNFVVALVLLYLFAFHYRFFPTVGWTPLTEDPVENLRSAALPVVAIAVSEIVVLYRVLRADLIQTRQHEYIMLARAKGASERRIMWKHALRPSSLSVLTLAGLSFARILGGTIIVESIFVLPGLGRYMLTAIGAKDLIVVQGVVAFLALSFLTVNFLVDIAYGFIDPRTRVERA